MKHCVVARVRNWGWCLPFLILCLVLGELHPSRSWAQSAPPTSNAVISLSVAPNDPARIVVGTLNVPDEAGVYYSEDGGVSWTRSTGIPAGLSIAAVEHDIVSPAIVYAGDGATGFLFRSLDGGRSFEELPVFLSWLGSDSGVGVLYAQNVDGFSILHAGTRQDGVLTSYDNGESWVINAIGLSLSDTPAQSARRVRTITEFRGTLYIGTHDGIFAQNADSDSWNPVGNFEDGTLVRSLEVYRDTLYAGLVGSGLWRSVNGVDWTQAPGFPVDASVFALFQEGTLLVAGTGRGLWVGNGDQWLRPQVDEQTYRGVVWTLEGLQGYAYAGTDAGWVIRSPDQGYSFQSLGLYDALLSQPLPEPVLRTVADTAEAPDETEPAAEEPAAPTPTPVPAADTDPQPTPTPAAEDTPGEEAPVAEPTPTPPPAREGFLANLEMPFDLDNMPAVEIPFLGTFSPLVFAVAVILMVVIVVGLISVFVRRDDDE